MRNVPINYAETILEPYWDSGESYPDNEKYSVLQNYQVCYHEAAAKIFPYWCGVRIAIEQQLGESPSLWKGIVTSISPDTMNCEYLQASQKSDIPAVRGNRRGATAADPCGRG
ncbi:MAG: hypothetical protein ACLR23_11075 [Clostridia bacterium]